MAASSSAAAQPTTWYQNRDFAAARVKIIPPGGSTTYVEPRPVGHALTDVTDFQYGQRKWSKRHMPRVIYVLHPSPAWAAFKSSGLPPRKRDAQGNPMVEQWPAPGEHRRHLLDFEVLPDKIGSCEHWWVMEAWRRLDPRIRWIDIHMRIEPSNRPSIDTLRSRVSRPREKYHVISWFTSPTSGMNPKIVNALTDAQRARNTTRGTTPGLIDPHNKAAGRIPHSQEIPEEEGESESQSESEDEDEDEGDDEGDDEDDDEGDDKGDGEGDDDDGDNNEEDQSQDPDVEESRQTDTGDSGGDDPGQESTPEYRTPPYGYHWSEWIFNESDDE